MAKIVTLLGDSIRLIGYGKHVPEMLGEGYEVRQPEDNCRFAAYLHRMIFDFADKIEGSDVVHYNAGLWDMNILFEDGVPFTPEEDYVKLILRITELLKRKCDKLIFALTTPVYPGNPHHSNERIKRYNSLIIPELEKRGVVINDLYSPLIGNVKENIRSDDMIHLTDRAEKICAELVVEKIKEVL
ncbi:MAG: SGNH/GDSL hydrolase family protein [Clostridia bacterium]|nr:SGNH/GDSL hydrolase family protein [Clostridia bacterium]